MALSDFFHVLNPNAARKAAVRAFVQKDPTVRLAWVEKKTHPTHLETILNWALVEGETKICIWGGDGTLNRALQFLSDHHALDKVELALVPAGTCNDFFRKNHSDQNEGIRQYFDLGRLWSEGNERIFLNNAGFGRVPQAIRQKPQHPVLDILALTKKTLQLEWQDKGVSQKKCLDAVLGIVCNSPYFNCGLHFDKGCDPKDSLLDGFFEKSQPKILLLLKLLLGRYGKALGNGNTVSVKSSKITVTSESDLYPQVDGEPATQGAVHKLIFEVQPKALSLTLFQRPF